MPPPDRRGRSLVVSLHDVAPHSWRGYADLLPRLADRGVDRLTLLVVPHWHGELPLADDPELLAWLSSLDTERFEICLHGYTHLAASSHRLPAAPPRAAGAARPPSGGQHRGPYRPRALLRGALARAAGRWYTDGEGEFLQIGYAEARRRLAAGRARLADLGFGVTGFTAPAWLLSAGARRALRDLGFLYTTYLARVEHLPSGASRYAPTLVWSVRSPWRRWTSLRWCRLWSRLNHRAENLRLALHPGDLADATTLSAALALAGEAAAQRRPVTYSALAARLWPVATA